ncbi:MAG TPA: hypothetical protein VGT03_15535 [Candidatus Acidoferrales bacterium]|nr:hypothetical protein [Candidatus Acidoferrales bacterium]
MIARRAALHAQGSGITQAALALVVSLLVVGLAWAGGDPWKTKPYQQWTQDDIRQILNDSPWARLERVPMDWRDNQRQGNGANPMERAPGSAGMAQSAPAGPGNTGAGGGPGSNYPNAGVGGGSTPNYGAPSAMGTPEGQTVFIVRWTSSQTVREALVRDNVLAGKMQESEAAQYLAQPAPSYQVTVIGPDMTPFGNVKEDELKAKTYLQAKQSKQKVTATDVHVERSQDGKQVYVVMFSFPKKTADGQDLISAAEKTVQFGIKLKDLDLHTGFDLRKMTNEKGSDL